MDCAQVSRYVRYVFSKPVSIALFSYNFSRVYMLRLRVWRI